MRILKKAAFSLASGIAMSFLSVPSREIESMLFLSKTGIFPQFEIVYHDAARTQATLICVAFAFPWILTWLVERFGSRARAAFTTTALLGWVSLPYGIAFAVKYSKPYWAAHWFYQGVWATLIVNALLVWFIPLPKHAALQVSGIKQAGRTGFCQRAALSIASGLMMMTVFGFVTYFFAFGEMIGKFSLLALHRASIMPENAIWTRLGSHGAFLVVSAMALPGILSWTAKRSASEMKSACVAAMLLGLATAPICSVFATKYVHSGLEWAVVWFCGLLAALAVAAMVVRFVPAHKETGSQDP